MHHRCLPSHSIAFVTAVRSGEMSVFAADHSRRAFVAATIVAVHAVALYAALTFAPQIKRAVAEVPLAVTFVSQVEPPRNRPLPQVNVVTPQPIVDVPVLPMIEIPNDAPPAARAITIPVAPPPVAAQPEDRSVPKLVSAVEYVREPVPRYPPQSRRLREQGLVVLRVVIDESGAAVVCTELRRERARGHTIGARGPHRCAWASRFSSEKFVYK